MGNSGFCLENQENCVFADNIKLGQMTTPLKDKQIIVGTSTTPKAAKFTTSEGLGVEITDVAGENTSNINISLDKDKLSELITEDLKQDITDNIVNDLKDELIKDILDQIQKDPTQPLSVGFQSTEITGKHQCNGIFTNENINTLLGGTEVIKFTFTPQSTTSSILVTIDVIASRMEGDVVLALVKEGDDKPCAISYNYSSGLPNMCQLRTVISNTNKQELKFSLRVGGLNSGVVWVNAASNGDDILNTETKSIITCMELNKQQ